MTRLSLEELINIDGTAFWRSQKAVQFPEDTRNDKAVEILERLAEELPNLEGGELHRRNR